jgi:membrane-bound serine protease (ClpP class)
MQFFQTIRCLLLVALLAGASPAFAETTPDSRFLAQIPEGAVVVAPLEGQVTEATFFILRRALKSAEAANASAFVIDMDTPGGSLGAAVKILNLLLESKVPTYTWVNTNAGSAGALIALGTKHIFMAPVSAIGAAAPVMGGGQEVPETMSAKIISYYSGYFRSAAEANGYNPELAEAFINREKELKIGDEIISAEGSLLTLSAQEAIRKIDGKPVLAQGIAANVTQLADQAGLGDAPVFVFQPSGFEQAAKWITTLAPLFLLGGIIGAYMEFKAPGFGVPGFVSAICFLLFFAGHYVAGLTGFEAAALFVAGFLLVIFELLLFPGVLFISAIGMLLMVAGLLFAMVDFWPSREFALDFETIGTALINFSITIVLAALIISLLARYLPSLPMFRFLFLRASTAAGPSFDAVAHSIVKNEIHLGDTGIASTILRPSGKADFGAFHADVVTDGDFIAAGTKVTVVRMEGGRVFVEETEATEAN